MGALFCIVCAFLTTAAYNVAAVHHATSLVELCPLRPTAAGALAHLLHHSQPGCNEVPGHIKWLLYAVKAKGRC